MLQLKVKIENIQMKNYRLIKNFEQRSLTWESLEEI